MTAFYLRKTFDESEITWEGNPPPFLMRTNLKTIKGYPPLSLLTTGAKFGVNSDGKVELELDCFASELGGHAQYEAVDWLGEGWDVYENPKEKEIEDA